ncbi:MAG: hypothetical protein F6K56_17725 [Moorea sp. SIO3G5]|nr:hypothetical protein [Moorena sp. SIO3G5]
MGRWGDGEMGEIFIKGNYLDMILPIKSICRVLYYTTILHKHVDCPVLGKC